MLLLSNSLGTRLEMWAPQMDAFTQAFWVLRYDSRGHVASTSPVGAYSIDRLSRDVIELADAARPARPCTRIGATSGSLTSAPTSM